MRHKEFRYAVRSLASQSILLKALKTLLASGLLTDAAEERAATAELNTLTKLIHARTVEAIEAALKDFSDDAGVEIKEFIRSRDWWVES